MLTFISRRTRYLKTSTQGKILGILEAKVHIPMKENGEPRRTNSAQAAGIQ